MIYLAVLAFGTALGLPIAVIFASTAQGKATGTALEGIARQPEAAPRIQTAMIIGLALIESLVIYSLLIFFLLMGKLPQGAELQQMIEADARGRVEQTK
jgi:F-type H+-transporting ATPase subunit c